jgi:hypothetical protein
MKCKRLVLAALAALPGVLSAQSDYFANDPNGSMTTTCVVQLWRADGDSLGTVRQVSFPILLTVPLNPAVQLTLIHTPAFSQANDIYDRNRRTRDKHNTFKINGLSDTWIQGTYLFPNNQAMVNLGIGAPTGKTGLNNSQFELARNLSRNLFRYQVPIYGQGFCARAGAAVAVQAGTQAVFGVGGQYLYRGKYHPLQYTYMYEGNIKPLKPYDPVYKPGDEATAQVGLDVLLGEKFKLMADVEFTAYQRDLLSGSEVFKAGTRLLGSLALYREFDQQYLLTSVRYRIRGKHEYLDSLALTMRTSERNLMGSQIEADVVYKAYAFRDGGFFVYGDARVYGTNEYDTDGALAIGGGIGIQFPFSEIVSGDFRIKFFGGNVKDPLTRNLLGLDASFGVRFLL